MFKKTVLFCLPFVFAAICATAQDGNVKLISKKRKILRVIELDVKKNSIYTNIDPQFIYTSLSVELMDSINPVNAYLFLGDTEKVNISFKEGTTLSTLLLAAKPLHYLSFFSGNYEGKVRFRLVYKKADR